MRNVIFLYAEKKVLILNFSPAGAAESVMKCCGAEIGTQQENSFDAEAFSKAECKTEPGRNQEHRLGTYEEAQNWAESSTGNKG